MNGQKMNQGDTTRLRKVQIASLTKRSGLDANTQELVNQAADKISILNSSDLYKITKLLKTLVSFADEQLQMQGLESPRSGFIKETDKLPDNSEEINSIPVESLSLSVRAYHCLTRHNLLTLGDVRRVLEDGSIRKIRNLGAVTEKEISDALEKIYGSHAAERWKEW